MSGDVHVRICEHPRGRFPRVTRLVIIFRKRHDAERVMEVLPKRFGKYGLTVHPEKTKLIDFRVPYHWDEAGKRNRTATNAEGGVRGRLICLDLRTIGERLEKAGRR